MRNLIIFLLIIAGGVYFVYTRMLTPDMTFEREADSLRVTVNDIECHFKLEDEARAEGFVIDFSSGDRGPSKVFAGIFLFMRDEVAAELALNKDKSKLSSEAQAVINQGCPANYLNQNTFQHTLLSGNPEIDKALRAIKKGDRILLKGNNAVIKIMTIDGNPITVQVPNILCVTYVEINNEVFDQK